MFEYFLSCEFDEQILFSYFGHGLFFTKGTPVIIIMGKITPTISTIHTDKFPVIFGNVFGGTRLN